MTQQLTKRLPQPICAVGDTVRYRYQGKVRQGRIRCLTAVWSLVDQRVMPVVAIEYQWTDADGQAVMSLRYVRVKTILGVVKGGAVSAQ